MVVTVMAARKKIFVPKHVWYFYDIEHDEVIMPKEIFGSVSRRKLLKAWLPYLVIAAALLLTRIPAFGLRAWLNSMAIHVENILGVEGLNYDFALIYNPGLTPSTFLAQPESRYLRSPWHWSAVSRWCRSCSAPVSTTPALRE